MAPVTKLFGAVASYNLLCILGPPLTAWTAMLWLGRHACRPAAFVGGLVFGFSPIVVAHVHGDHLNLTFLCLVPLIVMLVEDLLWRAERPWWPQAPLLGLLIAVQLLISTEVLALTALGCAALTLLTAAAHPSKVTSRVRPALAGAGVAVVVAAAGCAWPLYEEFSVGPALLASPAASDFYTGRPSPLYSPPVTMLLHTAASAAQTRATLSSVENGLYIGIPLLMVLAVAVATSTRRRPVLIATAIGLLGLSVELGWPARIPGVLGESPFRFLQDHVSLLALMVPARFAILVWSAVAFVVSDLLDRLQHAAPRVRAAGSACVVLSLVPLVPASLPYIVPVTPAPAFFTSSAADSLPRGATVMLAPMATVGDTQAMILQVQAGMAFRQLGGYMQHPGTNGVMDSSPNAVDLTTLFGITPPGVPDELPPSPALLAGARQELRSSHAVALLLADTNALYFKVQYWKALQLLGRPPDRSAGGVSIWWLDRSGS
jgi:hypothetical protein